MLSVLARVNVMVAFDSTEEGFVKTCKQAFGIDTETYDFAHERMCKAQHGVEASEYHMRHQGPCGRRQEDTRRTCFFPDTLLDVLVTRV